MKFVFLHVGILLAGLTAADISMENFFNMNDMTLLPVTVRSIFAIIIHR